MQMRMVYQIRPPTVEDGEEANLSAQMFGIGGDGAQGLGGGAEQNPVDHFFVLVSDGGNLFRHRKDHMEVLGIQKFSAAFLEPFRSGERLTFWTVSIRARVISITLMATPVTPFEMTAEDSRAADLDRGHDAPLRDGERATVLLAIVATVPAENICHFEFWALHPAPRSEILRCGGFRLRRDRSWQQVERTGGRAYFDGGDTQVARRGRQATMAHQQLNRAHVSAGFQQMASKSVAHGMGCDRLGDTATVPCLLARQFHGIGGDVGSGNVTWEEPRFGFRDTPPVA